MKVISHPITQSIKKKRKEKIASSELILQLLIQQTQTDFWGKILLDYGEGLEVRILFRPKSFCSERVRNTVEMLFWCDRSEVENRRKNTSALCAAHAQLISWTVWRQSDSEMEKPTSAIKYQFAPTLWTRFLSALCALLLLGLPQMSDQVRYILWGGLHKLCKHTERHTLIQRYDCGHSEGQVPLYHWCAPYFFF